jgi:hypothetical protein
VPTSPVLLVGGYGAVGAHAARTLRALHPSLPLLIAGRRLERAETLARSLGNARAITVDLSRPDLGLDEHLAIDAVAMFVKDSGLNGLRTATRRAVPYMTMSEYAFDVAPVVARWAHAAGRIPMMLLGHHLGGLATLTALHYAQEFADVSSIRIGALFDENDLGTATAQADAALAQRVSPHPLRLQAGRWTWANERDTGSTLQAADGTPHPSHSYSLLDVVSIAAASEARDVTFDVAIRATGADGQPRHEVIVEIDGTRIDQADGPRRFAITDDAHHARMSGQGAALALTHTAGLGNTRAAPPGLHLPETLLDPSATVAQLHALDVNVRPLPDVEAADNRGIPAR